MNWLKYLVGISAILVAGCAAFFSVTGLGVLFSGASVAVMIMASALELAKLVAATYLKQTWDKTNGFNKWYLTIAVASLMLITSAGIFGYLSNAFQQQNLKLAQIEREISVYDIKIKQNENEIARYTTQLNNLQTIRNSQEQNISKVVERNGSTRRLTQMVSNADKEITSISQKINKLTEENNKNYEEINKIKNQNIETEREVGGFRFVADAFGVELNKVVKFFIILIVFVFDPLAIALIIAFNGLIGKKNMYGEYQEQKNYQIYEDSGKNSPKPEEKEEIVENIIQSEEDKEVFAEAIENPPAPNEELVEAKKEYDEIIEPIEEKTENFENLEKLTDEAIENDDPSQNLIWEQYMHPDFPWHKKNLWINNQKAVQYWLNNKGGTVKELSKIQEEEANTKTY